MRRWKIAADHHRGVHSVQFGPTEFPRQPHAHPSHVLRGREVCGEVGRGEGEGETQPHSGDGCLGETGCNSGLVNCSAGADSH